MGTPLLPARLQAACPGERNQLSGSKGHRPTDAHPKAAPYIQCTDWQSYELTSIHIMKTCIFRIPEWVRVIETDRPNSKCQLCRPHCIILSMLQTSFPPFTYSSPLRLVVRYSCVNTHKAPWLSIEAPEPGRGLTPAPSLTNHEMHPHTQSYGSKLQLCYL